MLTCSLGETNEPTACFPWFRNVIKSGVVSYLPLNTLAWEYLVHNKFFWDFLLWDNLLRDVDVFFAARHFGVGSLDQVTFVGPGWLCLLSAHCTNSVSGAIVFFPTCTPRLPLRRDISNRTKRTDLALLITFSLRIYQQASCTLEALGRQETRAHSFSFTPSNRDQERVSNPHQHILEAPSRHDRPRL